MGVLANAEFAFLYLTFVYVELVPSCRNLIDGPETTMETTLDFFLELVLSCEQLFQLPHIGPLKAPHSTCQRFDVHTPHFDLALKHGSNQTPSFFFVHNTLLLRTGIVPRTLRDNNRVC